MLKSIVLCMVLTTSYVIANNEPSARAYNLAVSTIRKFEGFRSTPYSDTNSEKIGYGTDTEGDEIYITKSEATLRIYYWLREHAEPSLRLIDRSLTDHQIAAVFSFIYNLGPTAFKNSDLLICINACPKAVPAQLMRWVHSNGKVLKGLVRRRKAEIKLWKK